MKKQPLYNVIGLPGVGVIVALTYMWSRYMAKCGHWRGSYVSSVSVAVVQTLVAYDQSSGTLSENWVRKAMRLVWGCSSPALTR